MCNLKITNYKQKFQFGQKEFFAYAWFPFNNFRVQLEINCEVMHVSQNKVNHRV